MRAYFCSAQRLCQVPSLAAYSLKQGFVLLFYTNISKYCLAMLKDHFNLKINKITVTGDIYTNLNKRTALSSELLEYHVPFQIQKTLITQRHFAVV